MLGAVPLHVAVALGPVYLARDLLRDFRQLPFDFEEVPDFARFLFHLYDLSAP